MDGPLVEDDGWAAMPSTIKIDVLKIYMLKQRSKSNSSWAYQDYINPVVTTRKNREPANA